MIERLTTGAEAETVRLGELIGRALEPGDLILLYGELGAGKTTLVRGLARGVGYRGRVSSPTFALAHVYRGNPLTLHHLDLYRLKEGQTDELGLDELLNDPRGAVVVEWPQAARWPRKRIEIRLSHVQGGRRVAVRDLRARK
ncbi:MAG: tRNA (adenosine(37)-N6)-threonylcarbamoyltransferase complex ATPase subunit type 1 TsaE [Elusimicrobia bacterium]|nr:tRNA (adenosine(37)-N6)-threonylcarbamoyltransferase complex ATPase subunit type 1 TsaE [Elusimicrobiota bacterium]